MNFRLKLFALPLFAALLAVNSQAARSEVLSFAATRDSSLPLDQHNSQSFTYTSSDTKTDGSIAYASILSGTAKSQATYGVNRVAVDNNTPVDDEFLRAKSIGGPFAVSISVWTDTFTISGGTGSGTASISSVISGQFGPKNGTSYGGSGSYYLFLASSSEVASLLAKPFEFMVSHDLSTNPSTPNNLLSIDQNVLKPGYSDPGQDVAPGGQFGGTLTGELHFNYGESFTLVSVLGGYANDFGVLNAFNSAHFGITPPIGSALTTASKTDYIAAVPEPSSIVMLICGLSLISLLRRKYEPEA